LEWDRYEAGDYSSRDERFHIIYGWDRFYGNHWSLYDRLTMKTYDFDSLKQCKQIADKIINDK